MIDKWISIHRPAIKRKDLEYVLNSMIEEKINYGDFANNFEKKLSKLTGISKTIAVNSMYNAILLALEALDVEDGDEVILPSFAPQVYLNVITNKRAKPVLVDLDEKFLKPSASQIRKLINEKTKAVILIYYFGYHYEPDEYLEIFPHIIEDISSVTGIDTENTNCGQKSIFALTNCSTDNLITTGDGAAILCNDKGAYSKLNSLLEKDYYIDNYRPRLSCLMPDLNAAMGISQVESLKKRLKIRSQINEIFTEAVKRSRGASLLADNTEERVNSCFPINLKSNPKHIIDFFKTNNIEISRPYQFCLHHYLRLSKNDYTRTENIYLNTVIIPLYSSLLKADVEHISKAVGSIM